LNNFQKSIMKVRRRMTEVNRLARVALRQLRREKAKTESNIELFLDTLQAETGMDVTNPKNLPTVLTYVEQFARDQAPEHEDPYDSEGFPKDRGEL
jgi:hypothetical protein